MRRFNSPVLREIATTFDFLNPDNIVLTRGESLVAWGVRDSHADGDIDLVMPPGDMEKVELFLGWKATILAVEYEGSDLPIDLMRILSPTKRYDIYPHEFVASWFDKTGRGRVYPDQLKTEFSEQDEETRLHVALPAFTRQAMEKSVRQKDIDTIPLIDDYLQMIGEESSRP